MVLDLDYIVEVDMIMIPILKLGIYSSVLLFPYFPSDVTEQQRLAVLEKEVHIEYMDMINGAFGRLF